VSDRQSFIDRYTLYAPPLQRAPHLTPINPTPPGLCPPPPPASHQVVALARSLLPPDVVVQVPPNLVHKPQGVWLWGVAFSALPVPPSKLEARLVGAVDVRRSCWVVGCWLGSCGSGVALLIARARACVCVCVCVGAVSSAPAVSGGGSLGPGRHVPQGRGVCVAFDAV
jgi:hypothetical protein